MPQPSLHGVSHEESEDHFRIYFPYHYHIPPGMAKAGRKKCADVETPMLGEALRLARDKVLEHMRFSAFNT